MQKTVKGLAYPADAALPASDQERYTDWTLRLKF